MATVALLPTCLPTCLLALPYRIVFFSSFRFFSSRFFFLFPFSSSSSSLFACFPVTPSPIAIIIDVGSRISCFRFGASLRAACYSLLLPSNPVPLPSSPPSVIQPPYRTSVLLGSSSPSSSSSSSSSFPLPLIQPINCRSSVRQVLESWAHSSIAPNPNSQQKLANHSTGKATITVQCPATVSRVPLDCQLSSTGIIGSLAIIRLPPPSPSSSLIPHHSLHLPNSLPPTFPQLHCM